MADHHRLVVGTNQLGLVTLSSCAAGSAAATTIEVDCDTAEWMARQLWVSAAHARERMKHPAVQLAREASAQEGRS